MSLVYTKRFLGQNIAPGQTLVVPVPAGVTWIMKGVDFIVTPATAASGLLLVEIDGLSIAGIQTNSTALASIHWTGWCALNAGEGLGLRNLTDGTAAGQITGYEFSVP